jgi:hypothetical protein
MSKCNPSFQTQYAIVGSRTISIDDYQNEQETNTIPKCIPCNHELVAVYPKDKRAHFRHKNKTDLEGHPMTEWHSEWQSHFPVTEKPFRYKANQLRNRQADVDLEEYEIVLEFQHSKIASGEVNERKKDYALHNRTIKWVIDGQYDIKIKLIGERHILEFTTDWIYQSFLEYDTVYYDIKGFIYKVNPKLIKSYQIDVKEPKPKMDFIQALKNNVDLWSDIEESQYYLYVKQQGAGSGKTYGMIQLLNNDMDFANLKYIIFITKQHSAVYVMFKEFVGQYENGILTNLELIEPSNLEGLKALQPEGKKYIITYKHKITNIITSVIFATVDSFTYALGESNKQDVDKFIGIARSIANGTIKTGRNGVMKYAGINPILNKESMIMIDETQDLINLYGEAFLGIISAKYTNLCIVGDRLQSLTHENNALTYLYEANRQHMKYIKSSATNEIRRFSDEKLISFVNELINFEKYDLPKMTSSNPTDNDTNSLNIFYGQSIYQDNKDDNKLSSEVDNIMKYFINEVKTMKRVPEDFMIITPFTSTNILVDALEIRLNEFWKDIMENDRDYIENVKNNHEYWRDFNTNVYNRYAIFHKSEEGTSIDLSESNYATRIVSIHSAKGDGRKVVFIIGLTESALHKFSKISDNLIYDSLLHVAITRQKERLYFRLENNGDNICRRIQGVKSLSIITNDSDMTFNKTTIKTNKLCNYIEQNLYDKLHNDIIIHQELPKLKTENMHEKLIIDMGDHHIRYASMFMNIIIHQHNYQIATNSSTKKQNIAILKKIQPCFIKTVDNGKDYYKILDNNHKKADNNEKKEKFIPVLKFNCTKNDIDYNNYYTIIIKIMRKVCITIAEIGQNKIRYLCPLESVLLYYMCECIERGKYQRITISDIYNIIHMYSKSYRSYMNSHSECYCNELFKNQSNISEDKKNTYLVEHYNKMNNMTNKLTEFDKEQPSVNWLYFYGPVEFAGGNEDFKIRTEYDMLGYDDKNTYIMYIKPQFNELNYNRFIIDSIIDTFMVLNCNDKTDIKQKIKNNNVLCCVISTDDSEIYKIDITQLVKNTRSIILDILYDIINTTHSGYHAQYLNSFRHIFNNTESKPTDIINKLKDKSKDKNKYMEQLLSNQLCKFDDCDDIEEERAILEKFMTSDKTIEIMNKRLSNSLKSYLGLPS